MKLAMETIRDIATRLESARKDRGATVSDIAQSLGMDQGQVSRILKGQFHRLQGRVMQVCKFLGVDVGSILSDGAEPARRALEQGVVGIWDGTQDDATRIIRLLRALAEFRGPTD